MLLLLVSISALKSVSAQPQTLEFASGSGTTSYGSSTTSQTITFQENTSNPTAWNFTPYTTPTTTATFSISNEQYTLPTSQNSNGADVSFGATNNNSSEVIAAAKIFPDMDAISSPVASDFSSSNFPGQAGEGMSMTKNYAVSVFNSVMGLYNANANVHDSFYMANVTITFSVPVANPVLQIVGIGGYSGSEGFSSELMLTTPGVTLSALSGSKEFLVTPNQILNSASSFSATTGSGAASGSVLVNGIVSTLTFKLYMKGDGGGTWSTSSQHAGDEFLIGISSLVTSTVLPVNFSAFTAQPKGNAAELNWTTATEENSNYFTVQTSSDGTSWSSISEVKAAGNSTNPENYTYTDNIPSSGSNYYRIVEVSQDGTESYSDVRQLTFGQSASTVLTFYPNPVKNQVTITMAGSVSPESVTVMSVNGQQLQQNKDFVSGESIDLSSYAAGIYFLAIRNTSGQTEVVKILKN